VILTFLPRYINTFKARVHRDKMLLKEKRKRNREMEILPSSENVIIYRKLLIRNTLKRIILLYIDTFFNKKISSLITDIFATICKFFVKQIF